jgi:extracellular factor (EF) 3-hydroxypalmitic acid methyl ester biosynthesis protein
MGAGTTEAVSTQADRRPLATRPDLPAPQDVDRGEYLDAALQALSTPDGIRSGMHAFRRGMRWYRQAAPGGWGDWARNDAIRHPITTLLHRDPFTRRSYQQPHGFPGDAGLIDLIYYDQAWCPSEHQDALGLALYRENRDAPAPRAVRERRDHLRTVISRTALRKPGATVLAVAAGHLRELVECVPFHAGSIGRVVALDQDPHAIATLQRTFGARIETVRSGIRALLGDALTEQPFDLIYSAGLYDYLDTRLAQRLTAALFRRLAPGGELLIANFTTDVEDAGYMETYMGWWLNFRTPLQCLDLACELPREVQDGAHLYSLAAPDIAYLSMRRT